MPIDLGLLALSFGLAFVAALGIVVGGKYLQFLRKKFGFFLGLLILNATFLAFLILGAAASHIIGIE